IMMYSPRGVGGVPFFSWPLHCGFMLGASALLLAWSVKVVRKVALRQATGQLDPIAKRKRGRKQRKFSLGAAESGELGGRIRPVRGSPVIWKELRTPLIQGGRIRSIIGLVATIIALLITYAVSMREDVLDENFAHIVYILIFVIMGLITNAVLSATTITSEKEARSWPILLTTSLDDWQILLGKAVGVFRRCLPIWLLLAGHLVLFVSVRYIHPIAVVHLAMLVAWIVVFLCCSGLYFSARLKRTTSAVVANFCLALALWAVIPMLLGLVSEITHDTDVIEAYVSTNPVAQAIVIMEGAGGSENAWRNISDLDYDWPHHSWDKAGGTSAFLLSTMFAYMGFGFLFAWRAKCRFRRSIF
ncbi:MAG: ABC transporter permease, partial [Planctomycetota bacterium]